jgi:ketosteroid isomerase-like protein
MNRLVPASLALTSVLLAGCSMSGPEKFRSEILAADKAFCAKSVRDGPKAAFMAFIATGGKVLSETKVGPDAVNNMFLQLPPTATLTWEPAFVDVSASGDLGYTWGRFTLKVPGAKPGMPQLMRRGTYVTVWRHQNDGSWKVVLDGGNTDGER